jgi:hypothetical protein
MMLVVVRDMRDGIALLSNGALGEKQIDAAKARAIGTANLEKALTTLPTEQAAPGGFRVRTDDNCEAARILVPTLWDGLAKPYDPPAAATRNTLRPSSSCQAPPSQRMTPFAPPIGSAFTGPAGPAAPT